MRYRVPLREEARLSWALRTEASLSMAAIQELTLSSVSRSSSGLSSTTTSSPKSNDSWRGSSGTILSLLRPNTMRRSHAICLSRSDMTVSPSAMTSHRPSITTGASPCGTSMPESFLTGEVRYDMYGSFVIARIVFVILQMYSFLMIYANY